MKLWMESFIPIAMGVAVWIFIFLFKTGEYKYILLLH